MEITINIEKRHLLVFCIVIGIVAGMIVAYAYNLGGTGGVPSNFGHSVDEIDWSQTISNVKTRGITMGIGDYNDVTNPYEYFRLMSSQGYIGGLMHSRTGGFGENSLTLYSRDNRNIILQPGTGNIILQPRDNVGYVGIGTTTPGAKLDVSGNARVTGNLDALGVSKRVFYYVGRDNDGMDTPDCWLIGIPTTPGWDAGSGFTATVKECAESSLSRTEFATKPDAKVVDYMDTEESGAYPGGGPNKNDQTSDKVYVVVEYHEAQTPTQAF